MRGKLLATTAFSLLMGMIGSASAADVYAPEPMDDNWTGFYLGADVGWGEANMSGCIECDSESAAVADDLAIDGLTTGIHAGYNWQTDSVVFGIEGDVMFNPNGWDAHGATSSDDEWQTASVDAIGSLRGRLGIASGPGLYYITGGIALSNAEWTSVRDDEHDTADFDDIGGVFGGGFEFMTSEHVSVRAEGLYYFFNDDVDISDFNEADDDESVELDNMAIFRVGVSWHFGG